MPGVDSQVSKGKKSAKKGTSERYALQLVPRMGTNSELAQKITKVSKNNPKLRIDNLRATKTFESIIAHCSDRWKEAQGWRQYDVHHMEAEKEWRSVDVEWMEQQRRRLVLEHDWREMDMHQRWLDNLRREVDEKVQQLSTLSNLSALLAGFAIVALVGPILH